MVAGLGTQPVIGVLSVQGGDDIRCTCLLCEDAVLISEGYVQWIADDRARLWFPDYTRELDKINYGGRGNRHAQEAWTKSTGRRMPFKGPDGETWVVCHIYDWAVKCPNHYSHSAGLVLVHPKYWKQTDSDRNVGSWLKKQAFLRFQYDPTGKFSGKPADSGCGHPDCQAKPHHYRMAAPLDDLRIS